MRLDRLATLNVYQPISRLFRGRGTAHIPVLMYHAVQKGSSHRNPYYETNVFPKVFATHMCYLRDEGYQSASLGDALQVLRNGTRDERLVVITFDDGYSDFYENAFPILSECQFTATVFLMTGYMGNQPLPFKGKVCLTWPQVRELHAQGIRFGSHTVTHPQLRSLTMEEVEEELVNSKKTIEDHVGAPVQSFSYPYAFPEADNKFKRQLREALVKIGYENGVTTILGTASTRSDALFLPRLPVNSWDDSRFFQAKLEGHYDWLHTSQHIYKALKDFVGDR